MKDFFELPEDFMGLPVESFVTPAENRKNTKMVIEQWMLGPEVPSDEPGANKPYWMKLARAWQVDEAEARRQRCSNCEYFFNDPMTQVLMEKIPRNEWDKNAGFRGFCKKFQFICHDMRSCQAWEEREYEED